MKTITSAAALLGLCAAPAATPPPATDEPSWAIRVHTSDLVVVGEVTRVDDPGQVTLRVVGAAGPLSGLYRKCTVTVARTIGPGGTPGTRSATRPAARTIEVLTASFGRLANPRPAPAVTGVWIPPEVVLQQGRRYVLALRRLAGKDRYLLPAYPKSWWTAEAKLVERAVEGGNAEGWAWGEAAGGLRMAVVPQGPVHVPGGAARASVPVLAALRNVSDKAVAVNLFRWDEFFSLKATGPGGKQVLLALRYGHRPAPAFHPRYTVTLGPGELVFISPFGPVGDRPPRFPLAVTPGTWTLQATYDSKREGRDARGNKLWVGQVRSAPVRIEVREGSPPKQPPPGQRPSRSKGVSGPPRGGQPFSDGRPDAATARPGRRC